MYTNIQPWKVCTRKHSPVRFVYEHTTLEGLYTNTTPYHAHKLKLFIILNLYQFSSLFGVDGLVLWNIGSALSYFLVLVLWGALFSSRSKIVNFVHDKNDKTGFNNSVYNKDDKTGFNNSVYDKDDKTGFNITVYYN